MYRSTRTLSLTRLSSVLLLALLPFGGAATADEGREELITERTEFSKTYLESDGSRTLHLGAEPLHFEVPGGFEVIDPTLVEDHGWRNDSNSFPTRLPESLGDGERIELGTELGVRWRPAALVARLHSGAEVLLAEPSPSWGAPSEEIANAVLYPDLYPGVGLLVEVRRGSLNLELRFTGWQLPVAPEQIETVFLDAELDVDGPFLGAVEARVQGGESVDEVPLYFG
ncbi:MAG: hypothetical protein KDD11_16820, partial [Acidobacteria bacterium]|nr:hypothetical protein [Acidobacteriota bacterium]